jgi:hypothetical protein
MKLTIFERVIHRLIPNLDKLNKLAEVIDDIKVDNKGNTSILFKNNVIINTPTNLAINVPNGVFVCEYEFGSFSPGVKIKHTNIKESNEMLDNAREQLIKLSNETKNKEIPQTTCTH